MRKTRKRVVGRPQTHDLVHDARGRSVSDENLLKDATKAAELWQKQLASGVTSERRKQPATTTRYEEKFDSRFSSEGPASWGHSVAFYEWDPAYEPGSLFDRYGKG